MPDDKQKTVLVVEDEVVTQRALQERLEKEGHHVLVAADAEEGLQLFKAAQVDLILLDLRLGEKSGVDLLRELHSHDEVGGMPALVVVLSGVDHPTVKADLIGLGLSPDDYLIKTEYSLEDIVEHVCSKLSSTLVGPAEKKC